MRFLSILVLITVFSTGLFMLAAGHCAATEFDTFKATIGLDDGCKGRPGAAVFKVLLDGEEAFKSEAMKPGDKPVDLSIPLEKARKLTLILEDTGNGHGGDWGNWADARLVDKETGAVLFMSDLKEVVEQRWIDTRMDRNIVHDPLSMSETVYARGLGAISGSRMSYSGWNEAFDAKGAGRAALNDSALKKLKDMMLLPGKSGKVRIHIAGKEADGKLEIGPSDVAVVEIDTTKGGDIMSALDVSVAFGSRGRESVPLSSLVPCRIEHLAPMNTEMPGDKVILDGKRYFGAVGTGHKARLYYDSIPAQILENTELAKATKKSSKGLHLVTIAGVDSPADHPFATVVFSVRLDGELVYRSGLVTGKSEPLMIVIPFSRAGDLELNVDDFGDGRYQDSAAWADAALVDTSSSKAPTEKEEMEQYMLTSFRAYEESSGVKRVNHGLSAEGSFIRLGDRSYESGFGVYAPSRVYFKELDGALARRREALELISKAGKMLGEGCDLLELEEPALKAKAIDPSVSDIYPILGKVYQRKGDIQAAINAWERMIDVADSTRREKRVAKNLIDNLYMETGLNPSARQPRNQPPIMNHPLPVKEFEGRILTVSVGEDYRTKDGSEVLLPGVMTLEVNSTSAGKYIRLLVNARGLKPVLRIAKYEDTLGKSDADYEGYSTALEPKAGSVYEWQLEKGRWTIFMDYSRENRYDNTCSFFAVYSLSDDEPAKPEENWEYTLHKSGGADVRFTTNTIGMLMVPFTATDIEVKGAEMFICYPLYEYGSVLSYPYNLGLVLMLSPEDEIAAVEFKWPDAAYDVPMTTHGDDRKNTFFFKSIPGINAAAEEIGISVQLPDDTGETKLVMPEDPAVNGGVYAWRVPWDKEARIHAVNEGMDTKWISEKHRAMTVYLPDNPYNKSWLPEYMAMLGRIYDRESQVMGGYEPKTETFVYLTGPAQLSGYGGATWGGDNSETWIASTGRIGEYHLRYQTGGDGVEAHELKWVFLNGVVKFIPRWLQMGTVIWLEEQGKYAGDLAFPDYWTYTELIPQSKRHTDTFTRPGTGYVRLEEDDFNALTNDQKRMGDAMCWFIFQSLQDEYGEEFWPKFWERQRKNPDAYAGLDPRSRTIRAVGEIEEVSGDRRVRKLFERWGFDLNPDPQYSEERYLRLAEKWAFKTGDDPKWAEADFDDASWAKIETGKSWESAEEFEEYDGYAWYRVEFEWPGKLRKENLVLDLGKIDDCDVVYFNGRKIGSTGTMPPDYSTAWTLPRRYDVPSDLVQDKNVIAVRVYDGTGGGGICERVPMILSVIKGE